MEVFAHFSGRNHGFFTPWTWQETASSERERLARSGYAELDSHGAGGPPALRSYLGIFARPWRKA
jgi:hypothetical protein